MKGWKAAASLGAALWFMTGVSALAQDIVWAREGDIDSLDPQRATSTLSRQVWYQIYNSLLEFNDKGEVVPGLAESWTVSEDGKEVVFKLHDGIKCHDGTPFDADDVKWTAERALSEDNPSITKASWGPIAGIDKIDPLTIKFTLSKPFGAFVPFMADEFTSMLCDSNAEHKDFGISTAIGTGPWALDKWTKGSEIVLKKNPDYHNYGRPVDNAGPPHADRLIIRTMPEAQTRVAGLKTGELQVIVPPIQEIKSLQENPDVEVFAAKSTGQNMFLEFAVHRPPFNDERARQAVSYALDKDLALKIVFGDLVEREKCPISRGVFGHDETLCAKYTQQHDPAKAKALLEELGYGPNKPMQMVMATWPGDSREKMLQIFQNQLKQVGIEAKIEVMDIGTLNARVKQENNTETGPGFMDLMGWTWFDPDLLYLLWHSPGAYEGYTSPHLDELLEATRTTVDPNKRAEIVHEVFEVLLTKAVHVPVYSPGWNWLYAVSGKHPGFKVGPFDRPLFSAMK